MPVPNLPPKSRTPLLRRFIGGLAALALLAGALPMSAARPPEPVVSLPLEDLGFQGVPARYLLLGDSVLTVHFVDDTHLLVTFTSRGLLKRLPDADEQDLDQNVSALLLELPSGKVLARTVWRERDRGQYLWPIGRGRFILRVRSQLTLLNPLAHLAAGKPFEEEPFLELHRQVGYIVVSPDRGLISIETLPLPKPKPKQIGVNSASNAAPQPTNQLHLEAPASPEVQVNFFRLSEEGKKETEKEREKEEKLVADGKENTRPERLVIQSAGVVRAANLIDIPATANGYLDISQESAGVYLFDFQSHGGKRVELSPFDTSCIPHPHFVSATEFIAFGCRGSDDHQQMAGFNLRAEETWINAFPNRHLFPYIVAAPAAGRFALSRTLLTGTYIDPDNLSADQIAGQEVTVMQTWDGRTLFKMNASPFQRAGQNFDLSPNGQAVAILHDSKVQVYALPPLSRKDTEQLKLASASAPEHNEARINLGGKPTHKAGPTEEKTADESAVGAAPAAATQRVDSQNATSTPQPQLAASPVQSQAAPAADQAQQQVQEPNHLQNGDPDPAHRPPPTLYDKDHPRQKDDPKPSTPPSPQQL